VEDDALPEGLKRERKGPLNKTDGRGDMPSQTRLAARASALKLACSV
jgi:hypothetical protein